jgi:hypothetical protein
MTFRITKTAVLVISAVLLSGCSSAGKQLGEANAAQPTATPTEWHMTLNNAVDSISAAAGAAESVVRVAVQTNEEVAFQEVPHTLSTATVVEVISGEDPGESVVIRQFGDSTNVSDEIAPVLTEGGEYVLMLQRFHFEPSDDTGQWVTVGAQSVWEAGSSGELTFLGKSEGIPEAISAEEISEIAQESESEPEPEPEPEPEED